MSASLQGRLKCCIEAAKYAMGQEQTNAALAFPILDGLIEFGDKLCQVCRSRIEPKSNPTLSPPFRHHRLARDRDGLSSQQQSLQTLNAVTSRGSG
jgi:hypothetical protein